MKLHFDRFSKTPNVIKSADVIPIEHKNLTLIPYTRSDINNSLNEMVITLSNLILFLSLFY
ncbi:hypothetical protein PIROE2DRAFT_7325 [Piromyces sp. E2]|nr:hypothetical protein PIROE2DRAFT_7325 [Piromyces sp. E2]|eukprot:OUM65656.1 hypothetical protein PIROE2DRAFT_7325 [Piromyces sp. E2]